MLVSARQYQRAQRVVADLEARVREGSATPADHARLRAGWEECLCWEWQVEGRRRSDDGMIITDPERIPDGDGEEAASAA